MAGLSNKPDLSPIIVLRLKCIPLSLYCFVNPALRYSTVYPHESGATSAERISSINTDACVLDQKVLNFILGPAGAAKIYPEPYLYAVYDPRALNLPCSQ
jgi:hypothetical protein